MTLPLISPFFHKFIYSFHMPLFFFLSGYFLNTTIGFWTFVKKRFNGLLKPYFFTIFLIYFFSISFEKMSFATAITRTVKSLYASGYYIDWVQLWFLPHLFVVSLYAYLFYKVVGRINSRWIRWLILLFTLFIATLFLRTFYPYPLTVLGKSYTLYGLPYSLDLVLLSGFFFILGSETRPLEVEGLYGNIFFLLVTGAALVLMNIFLTPLIDLNTRVIRFVPGEHAGSCDRHPVHHGHLAADRSAYNLAQHTVPVPGQDHADHPDLPRPHPGFLGPEDHGSNRQPDSFLLACIRHGCGRAGIDLRAVYPLQPNRILLARTGGGAAARVQSGGQASSARSTGQPENISQPVIL